MSFPVLTFCFAVADAVLRRQSWNDKAILSLNPWLADLLGNTTDVPLTRVISCVANSLPSPIGDSFAVLLRDYLTATHDPQLLQCVDQFQAPRAGLAGGVDSLAQAAESCVNQPLYHTYVSRAPPAITPVTVRALSD